MYNLKEVEKLGAKKGIVEQSIKDVNQGLVDDGKVSTEKIGSGNFYWSFPSQQLVEKTGKLKSVKDKLAKSTSMRTEAEEKLVSAKQSRQPTEYRTASLRRLSTLKKERATLLATIESQKENDPEQLEQRRKKLKTCKDAANRWTDNVWALKEWVVQKQQQMESSAFDAWVELPADFDYV